MVLKRKEKERNNKNKRDKGVVLTVGICTGYDKMTTSVSFDSVSDFF